MPNAGLLRHRVLPLPLLAGAESVEAVPDGKLSQNILYFARALRGKMDELAIWKRALTEEQVKELATKGRPTTLWPMANP